MSTHVSGVRAIVFFTFLINVMGFFHSKRYRSVVCAIFTVLLGSTFAFFSSIGAAFGQEKLVSDKESITFLRHHAGIGLSFAGGTPTLGGNGAMFSALYAYSLSPMLDIEASLNYLGRTNGGEQDMRFSNAWIGDATLMFRLFDASDRFRIGAGVSFMQHSFAGGSSTSTDQNGVVTRTPMQIYDSGSLGAHLKFEYLIPLSQKLDFGLRGQIHAFSTPFSGTTYMPGSLGGSAGIGFFVRGNW